MKNFQFFYIEAPVALISLAFSSPDAKEAGVKRHALLSLKLTGIAPENGCLEDELSFWASPILRDELLVLGRVVQKSSVKFCELKFLVFFFGRGHPTVCPVLRQCWLEPQ